MKYYKFLTQKNCGGYSGYTWPVKEDGSTDWLETIGELEMGKNGFHLTLESSLIKWIKAKLFVAEYDGEFIAEEGKICCRKARLVRQVDAWNEKTQRLFAADCAERVLKIFEERDPNDLRPRKAIEAARLFAAGKIDAKKLNIAYAAAAAYTAAYTAYAAAYTAYAADATAYAAYTAAYAATADAAYAATAAAAAAADAADAAAIRRDEQEWQNARLLQYINGDIEL